MFALDAQQVRWYWCMSEFECVINWYTVYDALWRHHNYCMLAYYSTTIAMPHDSARWCWFWWNVCNGIVLALDAQKVRYWCMFEFECVIAWYDVPWIIHDHNLFHTHLLFNYNGDVIYTALRWCWFWFIIYGTVLCWLWLNRRYVGIGVCVNLNVQLLGIR